MPDLRSQLPSVTSILATDEARTLESRYSRAILIVWIRTALAERKDELQKGSSPHSKDGELQCLLGKLEQIAAVGRSRSLTSVINATGILLHTGLGRSPLCKDVGAFAVECSGTTNLELDLISGERGNRGEQLISRWQSLTGCEDSLILNNNAAATLLTLQALCAGREVVISRGQLVEIGGSFRLPEVFSLSGAILKEVGTTNRTRIDDYRTAIGPNTAAILRVHPSNYRIEGFADSPDIAELCRLGRETGVTVIDDIGSGCLLSTAEYGLPAEPTFQDSVAAGADLVLGSGDKLLGGPQSGIVLGRSQLIQQLRRHPLYRVLRIDKLTLAALQATLDLYLHSQTDRLPIVRMLRQSEVSLHQRAEQMLARLTVPDAWSIVIRQDQSAIGGGSLPGADLPTCVLEVSHKSVSAVEIAYRLRTGTDPVVTRIHKQSVVLDLRSVLSEDDDRLVRALNAVLTGDSADSDRYHRP